MAVCFQLCIVILWVSGFTPTMIAHGPMSDLKLKREGITVIIVDIS